VIRLRTTLAIFAILLFGGAAAMADSNSTEADRITVEELKAKIAKGEKVVIIDVRGSDYDSSNSKIKGAIRIAPAEIASRLGEIPRDKEVVFYCACSTDGGSLKARETLLANGFKKVWALKGGWNAWNQSGGALEPK
jgi:rhodanese-related sulfurtransferase